jgi:uncharacterized protein YjiS (DUF1127 family)
MAIDTMFARADSAPRRSLRVVLLRCWRGYYAWRITRGTRHALLEMTEDQLRDIGISRAEARREIGKSIYWD